MRQAPLEVTKEEQEFGAYLQTLYGLRAKRLRKSRRVRVKARVRKKGA